MTRGQEIIASLGLVPHPERGFFAETYRSPLLIDGLPHGAPRNASTAIYFLLADDQRSSALHRLKSDELFHLYEGGPVRVPMLFPDGTGKVAIMGRQLGTGERPQLILPAGTWFGAQLAPEASHALWGCTVAPGFDFTDFELADEEALIARYPAFGALIHNLRR
jgi:predicted cupin superfamily sugar epimerase